MTGTVTDVPALHGFGTPEARWARLGPYYASFPVDFVREVVGTFSQRGDTVLDPFCGRGLAPFIATTAGRSAVACDINPVAWVYAATKTDPHPSGEEVTQRIADIAASVRSADRRPETEFESLAFAPGALGFINAARRRLDWRHDRTDRTVAAFMLHSLQARLGQGLGNQMRPTRATSPDYSVRWWKKQGLTTPPNVDVVAFLTGRVKWRYAKGIPASSGEASVLLGDASETLSEIPHKAALVLTSPPYMNVTNYRADNWLRLWALSEGPLCPDWRAAERHSSSSQYETMLKRVLGAAQKRTGDGAVWWLRVDARERTLSVVLRVMDELLPYHQLSDRHSPSPERTQTSLYNEVAVTPGDVDLLYLPMQRSS